MNRHLQSGFNIFAAVTGLVLAQQATAQTARPILTRDVDRGTAQPVNGACSASFASSVGTCILYSVPAGKRLVVETVSYSVVLAPGQYLGSILFGLNTVLPLFQVGSPNLYGVSTTPYFNGVVFVFSATQPLRIYLDEGQGFVAGGSVNGGANNYEQDFSFSGFLVDK